MNKEVKDLSCLCGQLEGVIRQTLKSSHSLSHHLEHAVWEEDMVTEEKIVIVCSAPEFIELIAPILKSRLWTVNGNRMFEPFFRALGNVFVVMSPSTGKVIEYVSIVSAFNRYVDQHKM